MRSQTVPLDARPSQQAAEGKAMMALIEELHSICRGMGSGHEGAFYVRQT